MAGGKKTKLPKPAAATARPAPPTPGRARRSRAEAAVAEAVEAVLHPAAHAEPTVPSAPAPAGPVAPAARPVTEAPATPSAVPPPSAAAAPVAPLAAQGSAALAPFLPVGATAGVTDFDQLSRNMHDFLEESGKVAAELAKACDNRPPPQPFRSDVSDAVKTLGLVAEQWAANPARLLQAQAELTGGFFDLWMRSAERFASPAPVKGPAEKPADKRFADPEWRDNPVFDFLHRAFLLGSDWANALVEKAELDDATKEKAKFYVRQISSALSPSNFVATNPELLRETLKENGGNLVRGMKMLAEDIAAGEGDLRIRHTDTSPFELGVNMATTPGKVVFRNDLMELLQYAPSTETVLRRPLLIVPPWINKFYILDLNADKSFIRWAVAQGLTVFVVSWVNPDARHAAKDFEAYMREGILEALDQVETITGVPETTAIGYCVGGTLLAVTLAYMAAKNDARITSATLFTAQVDFTHAGDLKVFADESQIAELEGQMKEQGYLRGAQMAQAFNMLRPEDLIWSSAVNTYLKGQAPRPFDLLAWNSDSARMPAANHSFYLRNCYLENTLAKGLMEVAGEVLDLQKVRIPVYNLATREDHIAPARSVFTGCAFFGGPVRFVLAGSGHVAGVVNPPHKGKYGFTLGAEPRGSFEDWLAAAEQHPGSWWPDWMAWVRAQAPDEVPAREPGAGNPTLGDAPGSYVRVKS